MPKSFEDFTSEEVAAQDALQVALSSSKKTKEEVVAALEANVHTVAIGGKGMMKKLTAFNVISDRLARLERRHAEGKGKDMEAKIELARELKQIVRDATLKYAIDNDDTALLDSFTSDGGSPLSKFVTGEGAGKKPAEYATENGKTVFGEWKDAFLSGGASFFKHAGEAVRDAKVAEADGVAAAFERHHAALLSAAVMG